MKLFTKDINQKLFAQYRIGSNLNNQKVVAKIFNPYGKGRWYLLNSDPNDPDYLWAIVKMGDEVEIGSVSRRELESIRIKPFGLPLERDMYFNDRNAMELLEGLEKGQTFAAGGMTAGRYYKDNKGEELRFVGESQGKLLFKDGEKYVYKDESDFEEDSPKERGLFGFFEEGGEINFGEDLGDGFSVGNDVYITDSKSMYKGKTGFVSGLAGKDLLVTFSENGNERNVVVSKKGVEKLDAPMADGGEVDEEDSLDYNSISDLQAERNRLVRWKYQYNSKGADYKIKQLEERIEYLKSKDSKMAHGGKTKGKRYKVNVYYGGEMEDEEFYTDSLYEAQRASQRGEHSEIYDNHKKKFVELEYAKGGKLVGKQKNLDVNKNGKLDAEDFKMLRGEKMADGGFIDEVSREIEQIKKKYPNSKVSYYFAKNPNGKNYVIEAKENGKVVYSSYQQNKMAMGGKVKFEDKVKAIKESLLKRKKVSPKVQKDYGKTYSPKEAEESAKRIAASQRLKYELKKKFKKGGKTIAQTPAPKKDRVFGSSKNKAGSASSKKAASNIELNESIVKTLGDKAKAYNEKHSSKVSTSTLKAVMRRGMGAFSTSHRPGMTRQGWGYARVNKFLKKKGGAQVKAAYVQDDDLL